MATSVMPSSEIWSIIRMSSSSGTSPVPNAPASPNDDPGRTSSAHGLWRAVRILGVSGSLDAAASNTALLELMARALSAPNRMDVFTAIDELPYFSTDRDQEPIDESVRRWRGAVAAADAVVVATPEYAGGMPGVLKNALDWLVGSGELYGKPVMVVSAAPSAERGGNARRWVADVVSMQGATVLDSFTLVVPKGGDVTSVAQ